MKVTHICLCGPVTDNWSYQDNLLPKYHKRIGYDVSVITSQYIWNNNGNLDIDDRPIYKNEYGIKTIRLKTKYGTNVLSKFKKYINLYEAIRREEPEILFVHGIQFLDVKEVVRYLRENPQVKVYVDNHADFSNSATNWISKNILHKIIWKRSAQLINPYTTKFYGVLPARVEFLKKIYRIPKEKVDLLLMGADDEKVKEAKHGNFRIKIRNKYGIKENDFLIVSGGKIDYAKRQIIFLIEAVKKIKSDNIKLIIFGSVSKDMKEKLNSMIDGKKIIYIGWIKSEECYNYFVASDLGVFPGRHSVLWEQAVGTGLPCIFKYWKGTTHVDVGRNCKFLYNDSVDEIKNCLEEIVNNHLLYTEMKKNAETKGSSVFSYETIARKSIQ